MPTMTHRPRSPSRSRCGFTLAEVMVVLVLIGIVAAGLLQVIMRQQRFYSDASDILELRGSMRQVVEILPRELRGLSAASNDIREMTSSSIEFRSSLGSSVVCSGAPGSTTITIPPVGLSAENGLTSWANLPEVGDSLLIYNDAQNSWQALELVAAPVRGSACGNLVANAAEAADGWTLVVSAPVMPGAGAAVRFFRMVKYQLFQAADGRSYLGYSDCVRTRVPECSTIQPVSGPYLPVGGPGPSGLTLSYFDAAGNATADPTQVVRIDIVARAESSQPIHIQGLADGTYQDSLRVTVALRNR